MANIGEPLLRDDYFDHVLQGDTPERLAPHIHQEEIVGRTAKGRPRHVRVDNQGRIVLAPDANIQSVQLTDLLNQVLAVLKDVRLGLSLLTDQDLENKS